MKISGPKRKSRTKATTPSLDAFSGLLGVTEKLLGKNGCSWDRKQTPQSIKRYLIEEAYEAYDTLIRKNWIGFEEELGDLLFQIIFHARMAEKAGRFDLTGVISAIQKKLIDRHPHVFADAVVRTAKEQVKKWDEYKKGSLLDRVPQNMASLPQAFSFQERAARMGFDWNNASGVEEKLDEELTEWREAVKSKNKRKMKEELGDLLFTVVNLARWHDIDAEEALRRSNLKFKKRFDQLNAVLKKRNLKLKECSLEMLDRIWEEIKG